MGKKMGKYCKAYLAEQLRAFPGWKEKTENLEKEVRSENGKEVEVERQLTDDDILYIQENYVVTADIFLDEQVVFDDVTPEWIEYCTETLEFEIPTFD